MKEEEEQDSILTLADNIGSTYVTCNIESQSGVELRYEVSSPAVVLKNLEEKAVYMQSQLDELKKDIGLLKHKIEDKKFEKRKRLGK